jgi:hypothetical protein
MCEVLSVLVVIAIVVGLGIFGRAYGDGHGRIVH